MHLLLPKNRKRCNFEMDILSNQIQTFFLLKFKSPYYFFAEPAPSRPPLAPPLNILVPLRPHQHLTNCMKSFISITSFLKERLWPKVRYATSITFNFHRSSFFFFFFSSLPLPVSPLWLICFFLRAIQLAGD